LYVGGKDKRVKKKEKNEKPERRDSDLQRNSTKEVRTYGGVLREGWNIHEGGGVDVNTGLEEGGFYWFSDDEQKTVVNIVQGDRGATAANARFLVQQGG